MFNSRREIACIYHSHKDPNDLLSICQGIMCDDEFTLWKVVFCESCEVWSAVTIRTGNLHDSASYFHRADVLFSLKDI